MQQEIFIRCTENFLVEKDLQILRLFHGRSFRRNPALVVELKWDKTARGAITQIKEKEYCRSLEEYHGNLLLVGINYDRKTREHTCCIEEMER